MTIKKFVLDDSILDFEEVKSCLDKEKDSHLFDVI